MTEKEFEDKMNNEGFSDVVQRNNIAVGTKITTQGLERVIFYRTTGGCCVERYNLISRENF